MRGLKMRLGVFAAALLSAGFGSIALGQVTGTAKLDGNPPDMKTIDMKAMPFCAAKHADPVTEETVVADANGMLKNVIVYLKKGDGQDIGDNAVPKDPALLDQSGCMYSPHVLPMMVGQELVVKNDDATAHNVHSLSEKNPAFNMSQPNQDNGKSAGKAQVVETYKVKCDVHPWMGAWIVVLDNHYFTTTGDDGSFSIDTKGLPDGDYTFVAWQEKYGTQEQKVTIKDGKIAKPLEFTFKADAGADAGDIDPGTKTKVAVNTQTKTLPCCQTKTN